MAKTDIFYYVGVKYAKEAQSEEAKGRCDNALCLLAEKWGQRYMGTNEHIEDADLEFGFPEANRKSALSFLEEALDSGHAAHVGIAKGDRDF